MSKTIKELMEITRCTHHSIEYRGSRAILNHLDDVPLAYAYGYAGFVAVIKLGNGRIAGYGCSGKCIERTGWGKLTGFYDIPYDDAIDIISNNKLFVERKIDDKAIEEYRKNREGLYRDCGEYDINIVTYYGSGKKGYDRKVQYRLEYNLKTKKYVVQRAEKYSRGYRGCSFKRFVEDYTMKKDEILAGDYGWKEEYTVLRNTLSKEDADKIIATAAMMEV